MRATRTIAFVVEVSDNAHVTKAMTTSREESVLDDLHANWAQHVLIRIFHDRILIHRLKLQFGGGGFRRGFGFNGGNQSTS